LQSRSYIIEIVYLNSFRERKSAIYLNQHYHGWGYEKEKIPEDELKEIISNANMRREPAMARDTANFKLTARI
jgi:hypothetical protein